jgi:uncharacterized SAM-dependent methyltransferase
VVRPADEDFHDERTTYMQTNDFDTNILAIMRDVLGPDVQADTWQGVLLPYDAVYERRISSANTYDWWLKAHRQAVKGVRDYKNFASMIDYHTRFRGYCPRCQQGG